MPPTRAARWTTRSGWVSAKRASAASAVGEVVLGAGGARRRRRRLGAACRTTTRPRKPDPPVTRTRRSDQKSLSRPCRHHGRTGRGACQDGRAVARGLTRSSSAGTGFPAARRWPRSAVAGALARARRRRAGRRRRAPRARHRPPWTPPIEVRHLRLPRPLLYESWLCLRRPAVERATGPVDVVHATTIIVAAPHGAARRHGPRPRLPARAGPLHAPRAAASSGAASTQVRRDADLVLCSSQATMDDCVGAGHPGRPAAPRAAGVDPTPGRAPAVATMRRRLRARAPVRAVRRHARAAQEPAPVCSRRSTAAAPTTCSPWSARTAGATPRRRPRRPGAPARLRARPRPARAVRRRRRLRATRACGRASACRGSRRWRRARRW